ncbi:MAG: hypothetical protein AB7O88_04940 [Reyranellaceae bacterium]
MRAWYGRGRYWFVVAASASASTAWGWCGYEARWESLGREFLDWSATDFGNAIAFSAVPVELIAALAGTLESTARTHAGERVGDSRPAPGALH